MLRFSLLTLAGFVAVVGMACAALTHASPWIASLSWTITLFALMLATLVAVLGKSRRRGLWTGCAIVGWLFTCITTSPLLGRIPSTLLSTNLLEYAALQMPQAGQATPLPPPVYYAPTMTPTYRSTAVPPPSPVVVYPRASGYSNYYVAPSTGFRVQNTEFRESFVSIGQALWVLLLALGGGLLGQFLVARNERQADAPSSAL